MAGAEEPPSYVVREKADWEQGYSARLANAVAQLGIEPIVAPTVAPGIAPGIAPGFAPGFEPVTQPGQPGTAADAADAIVESARAVALLNI